jgi:hypothetical protein
MPPENFRPAGLFCRGGASTPPLLAHRCNSYHYSNCNMRRLEAKPPRQLNDSLWRSTRNSAEMGTNDVGTWIVPLRVVEDIEEISPDFKLQALSVKGSSFREREIQVGASRPPEEVPWQRSVSPEVGTVHGLIIGRKPSCGRGRTKNGGIDRILVRAEACWVEVEITCVCCCWVARRG